MSHSLILGMTESGKTSLAKSLAAEYKKQGFGVLVLDPMHDPGWQADFQTDNQHEFMDVFFNSRSCMVFVDEAGESVGQYDKLMTRTATKGRHWGHCVHYISQRGAMVNRSVRDQCKHLFLFATALEDCKLYAREFNKPVLLEAANFPEGEFFKAGRFAPVQKMKLFSKR